MKKINLEITAISALCAVSVLIGAFAYKALNDSEMKEKDDQITDLERALDVMEEANTSLKTDNETKQIIIDNLEYELSQAKWTSLGEFTITAYGIDCVGCTGTTATGTTPQCNRTIAVDPDVIPLGSEVMIDGQIYIAEDTGGAIKGNKIDLFVGTEAESIQYGVHTHEVFIRR